MKLNWKFILACPLLPALLLRAGGCRRQPVPSGLAAAAASIAAPAGAEKRFGELRANDPDLAQVLRPGTINTLLAGNPWAGRIRESGVSQQALFFVDDMSAHWDVERGGKRRLAFSIFHPAGSQLSYRVHFAARGRKWLAYERKATRRQFFHEAVELDPSWRDLRVTLETRGQGIGAWVNPRLIADRKKPRVFVVIVLDSVRADHTSLHGYARDTTPAWAALGRDGRVFRRAYSTSSWTLPAHVSMFSGRDLPDHRVLGPTDRIGEDYPLLAEVFQKNGFTTAAFTGGGFVDAQFGFHRGFQVYSNRPGGVFLMDSAERVLRHFKSFADQHWGEDLFVFLHTYQAHAPYKFPSRFKPALNPGLKSNLLGPGNFLGGQKTACFRELAAADRRELIDLYDTAIYYADQALAGGVAGYLKEKGAYDEATIAVVSDHGEEFYDHGSWEHGHSLYGELIRIPMVIKFPHGRRRGPDDGLTSIADLPSLLLQAAGLDAPPDFAPALRREPKRVLAAALPVSPIIMGIPAKVAFVNERFHFIHNQIDRRALAAFDPPPREPRLYELYDLRDEGQLRDLAGGRPPALKEFHERLAAYLRRLRAARGSGGALDDGLRRELKSLGYLGD